MRTDLQRAHMRVCDVLGDLADHLFVKGVKLTFIMRDPANEDCYMVVGDDTIEGAISALERSRHPNLIIPATTAPPAAQSGERAE